MSWTHSRYDTITPPPFARMSGITLTPRLDSMSSASLVVGPFAPSTTSLVCRFLATSAFIAPSSAAGIKASASTSQNGVPSPFISDNAPPLVSVSSISCSETPSLRTTDPDTSESATIFTPSLSSP